MHIAHTLEVPMVSTYLTGKGYLLHVESSFAIGGDNQSFATAILLTALHSKPQNRFDLKLPTV